MNFSDRVTLHKTISRGYDPTTGKNGVQVDDGITLPCNKSPVSIETVATTFGSYEREVTTVRLQTTYKDDADKAVIDGQKYKILKHTPHSKSVFYLEGVSAWS